MMVLCMLGDIGHYRDLVFVICTIGEDIHWSLQLDKPIISYLGT